MEKNNNFFKNGIRQLLKLPLHVLILNSQILFRITTFVASTQMTNRIITVSLSKPVNMSRLEERCLLFFLVSSSCKQVNVLSDCRNLSI